MRRPASLNHAYRLVWDLLRQLWIPVAETSRRRGKSGRVVLLGAGVLALAGNAAALPTGGEVSAGSGSIAQSGGSMTISQQSQNLAINWQDFGIGANESVTFQQPDSSAIALNRVLGQNASELLGQLNANGQVFILNPNGVLFGANAQVSVGGLVASTLGLSDSDLLAGHFTFSGSSTAGVSNAGHITAAQGGYVALIGASVDNSGRITAPLGNVSLAAGQQVTLQLANGSLLGLTVDQGAVAALAANHGFIAANGGQVLLTAQAADQLARAVVNTTGVIEAQTVDSHDGVIRLLGDMQNGSVNVAGSLDASAPTGGNGGFVETSAAQVKVAAGTRVSTLAADGATGTWLIDPNDYTIAASGGDIDGATLSSLLGSSSILIESSGGGTAGNGDINVNDAVSWSINTLILTAARDVNINAVMTASGSAGLALNTATANGSDSAVAGGTVNVGLNSSGFTGRVDFTGGSNSLSINGTSYTILTSLGAAGSTTGTDLQGISGGLAGHYALGADIDASATSGWNSGAGFTPIGASSNFTGAFNGLGHTISGLYIRGTTTQSGLFGNNNGSIANVGLTGATIADNPASVTNFAHVGAIAGVNYNSGSIANAFSSGTVTGTLTNTGGYVYAGGLVGLNRGTISGSFSTSTVAGDSTVSGSGTTTANVGGLVGLSDGGTLSDVYATGAVSGNSGYFGGLVGLITTNSATISNAWASGSVTSSEGAIAAGGLIGFNGTGTVSYSYATGNVSAENTASFSPEVGGLVGWNAGTISNSYALGNAYGNSGYDTNSRVGGLVGYNTGTVNVAYAAGAVSSYSGTLLGGLIGSNTGTVTNGYWDTETSGQSASAAGTGMTTAQLEAALPTGFSSSIWGNADNHSLPYLLSNVGQVWIDSDASNAAYTLIFNVSQLQAISSNLAGHYALATDIDASATSGWNSGAGFDPLGDGTTKFTGIFDGLGHTVSNLFINRPSENFVGLFGYASGATLRDVGLISNDVTGSLYVGGLVGYNNGSISNAYANGGASTASGNAGGLVGYNFYGSVSNAYATSSATATGNVAGGLVGTSYGGTISNAYATGSVSAYSYAGGLVGYESAGSVINTYATGSVNASATYAGGLVGINSSGSITTSYATGSVTGGSSVGGLVGAATGGSVSSSYWNTDTSGQSGSAGGSGLTTAQMQQASSFSGWSLDSSGGAATTWRIYEGATGPLLKSFLTTLTVTATDTAVTYNGNDQYGTGVSYSLASPDLSQVLGATVEEQRNAGSYTLAVDSLYSTQQGYDIVSSGNATLTIDKAAITVSTSDVTKTYDASTSAAGTAVLAGGTLFGSDALSGGSFAFANKNAGTNKTVTVSGVTVNDGNSGANYSVTYADNTSSTINQAALTLDAVTDTKVYDATTTSAGTVVITGLQGSDSVTGITQSFTSKDVLGADGSTLQVDAGYTVNDGNGGGNYAITANTATGTITPAALTLAAVIDSKVFDGTTSSAASVSVSGLQGSDTVGSLTQSFASKNVLGMNGSTLAVDAGYVVNDGNSGGNYVVTENSASGTITPAAITVSTSDVTKTYDATTSAAGTAVLAGGSLFGSDALSGGSFAFTDQNAGTNKTVTVSGVTVNDGNSGANYSVTYADNTSSTINQAALTLDAVTDTKVYDATTTSAGTVVITGLQGSDSVSSLTQSFTSKNVLGSNGSTLQVDAGYVVNDGNGGGNYVVSTNTATGTITAATLNLNAATDSKVYDGTTTSAGTASAVGLQGSDSVSGLTQSFASKNVLGANGSTLNIDAGYTVNDGNGGNNYSVVANSASGTITPAALTLDAVADSKVYDGSTVSFVAVAVSGLFGSDSVSSLTQSFASKNVLGSNGSTLNVDAGYVVNDGNGGANYSVTANAATGTIAAASLTLNAVTDTKVYDATTSSGASVSITGLAAGDSISTLTQSFASQNVLGANGSTLNVDAGYVVNDGNGGNNYSISTTTATGTITPAALTLAAVTDAKTYDATTASAGAVNVSGLQGSDSVGTLTQSFASQNVLGANASTLQVDAGYVVNDGNGGANYSVSTTTASGTITPATLTLAAVSDTKTYDATTSSAGTASVSGLQGADSVSGLTQSFASRNVLGKNGSTLAVDAGYTVNDGNSGANYSVVTTTASGTINQALLTLAAVTDAKVYDGTTTSAASVSVSGLQGSDSVTGLIQGFDSQNVLGANGSTLVVNSGYVVNDGNSGNNYSISTTTATGTITPAAITVSTSDVTKTYDATTSAAGTAVLAGGSLFGSDSLSGGSFAFTDANAGTNKTVTVSGVTVSDGNSGANYSVTYADNTSSTINQAALTLDAVTDTKVYDATTTSAGTVVITGLQGSDSVTGITQSFASKDVLGADGSTLQVDAGYTVNDGNGGGNYAITANTATGTITPAALTVTANDATRPVGAPDPAFSVRYDGFVGGEDESVLGGTLDFSSPASRSAGPGDYALTPFGLMSGNYSLTFVDGVLSVTGMTPAQLSGVATAGGFATGSGGSTGNFGSASGAGTSSGTGGSNGAGTSLSLADAGTGEGAGADGTAGDNQGPSGTPDHQRRERQLARLGGNGGSLLQVQGGGMRQPDEL